MAEKHLIRQWRGSRASYNNLKQTGLIDAWTIYHVVDVVNSAQTITDYFGENIMQIPTGQLLAVKDLLHTLPSSGVNPYDRYIIGNDLDGYKIYEFTPIKDSDELAYSSIDFDWKYGVRILSQGLKNYVYYDSHLITYDDIDCGEF